jgi:hypothetical protein
MDPALARFFHPFPFVDFGYRRNVLASGTSSSSRRHQFDGNAVRAGDVRNQGSRAGAHRNWLGRTVYLPACRFYLCEYSRRDVRSLQKRRLLK